MKNEDLFNSYDSLDLIKLPETLKKNGYDYKLINRTKEKLMYSQSLDRNILGYEVFKNRIRPWREMKINWAKRRNDKTDYSREPEWYETFPSDEAFGKTAWTFRKIEDAQKAFDSIDDRTMIA